MDGEQLVHLASRQHGGVVVAADLGGIRERNRDQREQADNGDTENRGGDDQFQQRKAAPTAAARVAG